jgi:hypothetical protein
LDSGEDADCGMTDPSEVTSALIRNLIDRFDFTRSGTLDAWELDLVRDRLHRSLEEKDEYSVQLMDCWLDFQRGCPEANLAAPDEATGRTILHALAQSHHCEELFGLLEGYCEEICPSHPDMALAPFLAARDNEGHTPLWLAAAAGASPQLCVRFLELGSDVHSTDNSGVDVLQSCLAPGYQRPGEQRADVATVLCAFGAVLPRRYIERQARITEQLLLAARLSKEEARKMVSKWKTCLDEARQCRILKRMNKSAPAALPMIAYAGRPNSPLGNEGTASAERVPTPPVPIPLPSICLKATEIERMMEADDTPVNAERRKSIVANPMSGLIQGDEEAESGNVVSKSRAVSPKDIEVSSEQRTPKSRLASPGIESRRATSASSDWMRRSAYSGRPPLPRKNTNHSSGTVGRRSSNSSPIGSKEDKGSASKQWEVACDSAQESVVQSATSLEDDIRHYLLRLSKNHIASAFRIADFDCDNHVGPQDLRHLLSHLHLADGEEAKSCLHEFGSGMKIRSFAAWLRGKTSWVELSSHVGAEKASVRLTRNFSDRLLRVSATKLAVEHGSSIEDLRGDGTIASPELSLNGDILSHDSLLARQSCSDEHGTANVSHLPHIVDERSRSPAKVLPTQNRQKNAGSHSRNAWSSANRRSGSSSKSRPQLGSHNSRDSTE